MLKQLKKKTSRVKTGLKKILKRDKPTRPKTVVGALFTEPRNLDYEDEFHLSFKFD